MREENDNVESLIDFWETCNLDVAEAAKVKDYKQFKTAINRGQRIFRKITRFCEKNDLKLLDEKVIKKVKSTAKKWLEVADSLEVWKNEIAEEMKKQKMKNKQGKKILKHYHFSGQTTGINLKMKAN